MHSFKFKNAIPLKTIFTFGTFFLATAIGAGLLFVSPTFAGEILKTSGPPQVAETDHRSIGDYRRDVKTFMKLSKHDDKQLQRNAIYNLCELHRELVADPRFKSSNQIQSYRVVVSNRLEGFTKDVAKANLAKARKAKKQKRYSSNQSSSIGNGVGDSGEGSASDFESQSDESSDESDASSEYEAMYQAASDTYQGLGQMTGGPNQFFNYAGGQLGPPWDHGPELVALIQSTIHPSSWRDNGGNGAIHYFQPLRVLVITASSQVHEDTEDLLWKLRAAQ